MIKQEDYSKYMDLFLETVYIFNDQIIKVAPNYWVVGATAGFETSDSEEWGEFIGLWINPSTGYMHIVKHGYNIVLDELEVKKGFQDYIKHGLVVSEDPEVIASEADEFILAGTYATLDDFFAARKEAGFEWAFGEKTKGTSSCNLNLGDENYANWLTHIFFEYT